MTIDDVIFFVGANLTDHRPPNLFLSWGFILSRERCALSGDFIFCFVPTLLTTVTHSRMAVMIATMMTMAMMMMMVMMAIAHDD